MHITTSRKGYSMINMLFILMTVTLISVCAYKIMHNNILRSGLKVKYIDLYNLDKSVEETLSEVNLYAKNNTMKIDEIIISNESIKIKTNVSLIYDSTIDKFLLIDSREIRRELQLRYEKRDGIWFLLPIGRRYRL